MAPGCMFCGGILNQPERGRRRRYCSRSCRAHAYRARRATPEPSPRARPHSLNAVAITRTAVDLADREGIEGLSMRRLAGELGVATAALYRYFTDRERLLVTMTELALAESPPPPAVLTHWRERLHHEATQEWLMYQRHPWLLPLLARTTPPISPSLLDILERSFAALDTLPVPRSDLLTTYLACSGLVQGLALLRNAEGSAGREPTSSTPAESGLAEFAELTDPALRPALHKALARSAEPDFDTLLDQALDLLLDGVAVRYRTANA